MMKIKLYVENMKCKGCENRLINALRIYNEIYKVKANYKKNEVIIIYKNNIPLDKIINTINDLDFKVVDN